MGCKNKRGSDSHVKLERRKKELDRLQKIYDRRRNKKAIDLYSIYKSADEDDLLAADYDGYAS